MEDIVKGCIKGDSFAQQKLYEAFYGKMMAICMRYATDRQQAKDFLHDGFMKVFKNIEKFSYQGSLEGWIRKVMVNNILEEMRRNKKIFFTENPEDSKNGKEYSEYILEEETFSPISQEEILASVQMLPAAYRAVFNLYVMENFTHREISEQLDISEGTSKSNLSKARIHLKKAISQIINKYEHTGKR